jgi:predicted enzyme related to lactoylglutathione lyase
MQPLFKGINVASISVTDLDLARSFYRDTLGLGDPLYDLPEAGWIEFSTGRESGNLSVVPATPDWEPSTDTTVVLDVEDCHAAVVELRARGVRCDDAQEFPGFVTFASFYDPFGNRLQMCSPAPQV